MFKFNVRFLIFCTVVFLVTACMGEEDITKQDITTPEDEIPEEETDEPKVTHSAAVVYREFENGIVIANLSDFSYTFNLSAAFPGQNFRRIQAGAYGDKKVNNGQPVEGKVTIPRRDALFLVKE